MSDAEVVTLFLVGTSLIFVILNVSHLCRLSFIHRVIQESLSYLVGKINHVLLNEKEVINLGSVQKSREVMVQ
jgi:hypothetical protein